MTILKESRADAPTSVSGETKAKHQSSNARRHQ